jgi:hypothetical protein
MLNIRIKIIAYSVTDIIHIDSTVNGSDGEYNTDILRLPTFKLRDLSFVPHRCRGRR